MRAALALLLCSCALIRPVPQPVSCVSQCGLVLYTPRTVPAPTCQEFQDVEDRALGAFATLVEEDVRFAAACRNLGRFGVEIGDPVLVGPNGSGSYAGLTLCEFAKVFVGYRPQLARSALAHELAHAVQGCKPLPPYDPADVDHSGWGPINAALRDAGFP